MPFTVREFQDLVRLLEEHPEWRQQLLRVLFPEVFLNLPQAIEALAEAQRRTEAALEELAQAQRRTEAALEELTKRVERVERQLAEAAEDRKRIWEAIERVERQLAEAAEDRKRIWEAIERVERQLAEAAEDRRRIWEAMQQGFAEAAEDRRRIWEAMQQGFAEAAEDRRRIWEAMQQGFAEAAEDRRRIWEAMQQGFAEAAAERQAMRQDIGRLKGLSKEAFYRDRAVAIFGPVLRRGREITAQVVELLGAAQQAGQITPEEARSVLASDLLWSGRVWDTGEEVTLVVEASWTVGLEDVERAAQRAAILRQAGLRALPVAAGEEWPAEVQAHARRQHVVIVQDGRIDGTSWQEALAQF